MGNKSNGRKFARMDNIDYFSAMGAHVAGNRKAPESMITKIPCPYGQNNTVFPGMERVINHGKTGQ